MTSPPVVPVPDCRVTVPLTATEFPEPMVTAPVVPVVDVVPVVKVIAPLFALVALPVEMETAPVAALVELPVEIATTPDELPDWPAPVAMLIPPLAAPALVVSNCSWVLVAPFAVMVAVPLVVVTE